MMSETVENTNMAEKPNPAQPEEVAPVKTSARSVILVGLIGMLTLFGAGGAWAWYTTLSGAVIAQGTVVVSSKPKSIQHADGGIVAEIHVSDGDLVEEGERLITLNATLLESQLNIYRNRLRESLAQKMRLLAERDQRDEIAWDNSLLQSLKVESDTAVRDGQRKLFEARRKTRLGQIAQLEQQLEQLRSQFTGVEAVKASKNNQIGFLKEELSGIRSLSEEGLAPKSQLMALERQRESLTGQIAEHDAENARIQNSISEISIQILQIDREFRESVLSDLRTVEQEVNDTTQQLIATTEQLSRIEIRAPVKGTIHELSIFTIGGVISPANTIMQIIPFDDAFEIEADVEPQFIDDLFPGQPAMLRFSAFNQRTTPELRGELKAISASTITNQLTGLPYYKVYVSVPHTELALLNDQRVIPGMPVETFLQTSERSPISYLLKPLSDQFSRAFREN